MGDGFTILFLQGHCSLDTMSALDEIRDGVLGGVGTGEAGENNAELIAEWPDCSPQCVLSELHKVGAADKGQNKKGFWASYTKDWTKLGAEKQSKCRLFFQNLNATLKTLILANAVTATNAANAAKAQDANKANEAARKANTTKHEVARIMHLVKDSRAAGNWGKIQNPMTRRDLDVSEYYTCGVEGCRSRVEEWIWELA